ncbi:MAG TPA: PepSY domain-containing protein [Nitrospira sp.]|nr:PepSY domain-containing protein [Nitrospira sp.]
MKKIFILCLALPIALAAAGPAFGKSETKEKLQLSQDAKVTAEEAIKTATDKVPGKVIEAEIEKKHGKAVWEIEIATADNRIMEVHLDSASGTVIDVQEKGKKH